jgi:hypothetical protein
VSETETATEMRFAFDFRAPFLGGETAGGKVRAPALLFTAGEYPDKAVTVTPDDLDAIIARFQAAGRAPVPVKAEHIDTPLDPFGEVVALHREGSHLYGTLVFSEGVYQHIRERGVRNLSVALVRDAEGFALKEASLVFQGRVPGAGFLTPAQVGEKVAAFRATGKITPAMEPHVSRLLSAPSVIAFGAADGTPATLDVAGTVEALIAALPVIQPRVPVLRTGEPVATVAPIPFTTPAAAAPGLTDVQRHLAARFGVAPETVAAFMKEGGPA